MKFVESNGLLKYWNTLWFLIGLTVVAIVVDSFLGYRTVGFVFLVGVLVVGLFGDMRTVLFAAAFSTLTWNFGFITPRFQFAISAPEDTAMCVAYFFVAAITGVLTNRIRQAERLKESEKLHQTLLNSISHEMRTPLTVILGASEALGEFKDPKLKEISEGLTDAGERLNRVIENLLDMSRLNSGVLALNLEWQDISDLIGVVLQKNSRALAAKKIDVEVANDIGLIRADFRLFEHAISNIILNAANYAGDNAEIKISAYKNDGHLKIVIEDNGKGIPTASIPYVFDKFYRVPGSAPGGTGLGLSIVKEIVELHKGAISYEKAKPGARFVIVLPIEVQPMTPREARA